MFLLLSQFFRQSAGGRDQGKQVYINFDSTTCTVGGTPFLFL
jgi:hypothetical protein